MCQQNSQQHGWFKHNLYSKHQTDTQTVITSYNLAKFSRRKEKGKTNLKKTSSMIFSNLLLKALDLIIDLINNTVI